MKLRPLALAAALVAATAAQAWNATGHMVVAAIAQANLSPTALAECGRLLKVGAEREGSDDFVSVGPWADDVRSDRKETGSWHYKDLYFRPDGKPAANRSDEVNAVTKVNELIAVVRDHSKPDAERADALRFVIHIVGDLHQPLHATSRETDAHPKGDRGGNDYLILPPDGSERGPKNLHSLWDSGAGLVQNYPRDEARTVALAEARALMAALPKSSLPNVEDGNPDDWAQESFESAKKDVYSTPEGATPSFDYLVKSQGIAARRLALAGYRLADLLNKALGPK